MARLQQSSSKAPEYPDLTDKEFKRAVVKKFSELQENSERQFSEIREKVYEQNELCFKEIKITFKKTNKFWK